jgi:hypothetical protein
MTAIDSRELENAYLAGLFDGEGCIYLTNVGYEVRYPGISIAQTDSDFLHVLKEKYGGQVNKSGTTLYFTGASKIAEFLTRILPYLILRHKEAFILIEICKLVPVSGKNMSDRDKLLRLKLEDMLEKAANNRKLFHKGRA